MLGVAGGGAAAILPAAPTANAPVGWGLAKAIATPGIDYGEINSLSCAGPGDCVAGGSGSGSNYTTHAFLAEEKNGTWGAGKPVPGLAALSTGYTSVNSVSCPSPGNCTAGGEYDGGDGAFVVNETSGTWADAAELPGISALTPFEADISQVACTAAGDCAAIGTYTNEDDDPEVFVAQETHGTWSDAEALPGFAALNAMSGNDLYDYLSCTSTGSCAAAGSYVNATDHYESFVAAERNGTWSALSTVPDIELDTLSCPSAGNCVAAGEFNTNAGFVAEKNGTWSKPAQTPGITALKGEEDAGIADVSCPAAGDCAAVGTYYTSDGASAFVDAETDGAWGRAEQVPGLAALNLQLDASGLAVACSSPGYCSVGGSYAFSTYERAFLAQQTRGSWGAPQPVVGLAALGNDPQEAVTAITCAPAGSCSAAGIFSPTGTDVLAPFAVSQVPLRPTDSVLALTAGRAVYGDEQAVQAAVAVSAASGTAVGPVTVRSGSVAACTLTLSSGTGTCTLPAARFAAGTVRLVAAYGGGPGLAPSVSATKTLTVVRAATTTRLRLSAATVTYGDEQAERLTVTVIPRYAGTATGTVTVKAGSATVCVIRLKSSRSGSCTLAPKKLGPGTYHLVARYAGSADFTASASGKATLKVVK